MDFRDIKLKDLHTYQDCVKAVEGIKRDPDNNKIVDDEWILLKTATRKVEAIQRKATKLVLDTPVISEDEPDNRNSEPVISEDEPDSRNSEPVISEDDAVISEDESDNRNGESVISEDDDVSSGTKTVAYIRVSDAHKGDSRNQRHVIQEYANANNIIIDEWQEFHISGSKACRGERGIDELLVNLNAGDNIIVSDVARLGRDTVHSITNTITSITTQGATLHCGLAKNLLRPDDANDLGKLFMFIGEAYAAVKFAEERSAKSKAAVQRRKNAGLPVGRQKGTRVKSKLDEHAAFILNLIEEGTPKTEIVKLLMVKRGVKVTRPYLYEWLKKRNRLIS